MSAQGFASGANLTFESHLRQRTSSNVKFKAPLVSNIYLVVLMIPTFARSRAASEGKCRNRTPRVPALGGAIASRNLPASTLQGRWLAQFPEGPWPLGYDERGYRQSPWNPSRRNPDLVDPFDFPQPLQHFRQMTRDIMGLATTDYQVHRPVPPNPREAWRKIRKCASTCALLPALPRQRARGGSVGRQRATIRAGRQMKKPGLPFT